MEALTDRDLLAAWDTGINLSLIERSLLLLSKVFPDRSLNEIGCLTIGERDACLLNIREQLFGSELNNVANCPNCSQKIEWKTSIDTLRLKGSNVIWNKEPIKMAYHGLQISFRIPNSKDILEIMEMENPEFRQSELLNKCLSYSSFPSPTTEPWPDGLQEAIIRKMEECDPQADISMKIVCPDCGHHWHMFFDIMRYLWSEIDDWAIKLIQDIYLLALNFGWSEHDILSLSRFRRNLYINMIYA